MIQNFQQFTDSLNESIDPKTLKRGDIITVDIEGDTPEDKHLIEDDLIIDVNKNTYTCISLRDITNKQKTEILANYTLEKWNNNWTSLKSISDEDLDELIFVYEIMKDGSFETINGYKIKILKKK